MSQSSVAIDSEKRFQVMPDLDAEEFRALKDDIEENGIIVPITVDESGAIIDGYHRHRAAQELGYADEDIPRRPRTGLDEHEKRSLAYRLNMQRRHVDTATKKDLIKQRLNELIDAGIDKTDEEIADELGCARSRVSQVRKKVVNSKISDSGENVNANDFTTVSDYATSEQKDRVIKDLLVENPERSNREIADQIGVDKNTVGKRRGGLDTLHRPQLLNTDVRSVLPRVEAGAVDLIVTDPPYGIEFDGQRYQTAEHDPLPGDADTDLFASVADELHRVLAEDSHAYLFTRWDVLPKVLEAYTPPFTADTVIVWDKDDGGHGMGDLDDWAPRHELVVKLSKGRRELEVEDRPPNVIRQQDVRFTDGENQHPTQKPVALIRQLIEASSVPGELVFDPFGGVHTTPMACVPCERRCLSVEVDTDHHAAGRERVDSRVKTARDDRTLVYDVEVIQ